jgi:integrase
MSNREPPGCILCGGDLRPCDITFGKKTCVLCLHQRRVAFLLSDAYLNQTFLSQWTKNLFKRLGTFLQEHEVALEAQARLLSKVAPIFQEAEQSFGSLEEMSEAWLVEGIEKAGGAIRPTYVKAFLLQEHLITAIDQDDTRLKAVLTKIEHLPQGYRRLMEVYFHERIAFRKRQMELNAKHPLAVRSIEIDFITLSMLVRWLMQHLPDLTGWQMVQEEHLHAFLLSLKPTHRELVRGKLQMFFNLGRKRRIITHVPIANLPERRLPLTVEPLLEMEQKALARKIRENLSTHPEEAFVTALCFYHGLSTSQICHIRLDRVDVEQGKISIAGRTPVYLLAEDFLLLEQFLQLRSGLPHAKKRGHLFISNQSTLDDIPVTNEFVADRVRAFSGHTPRCLRITCFTALSARYGPQYLVEAFGLSLDQAARYVNLREFLLEEEIKQQKEEFLELTRTLEDQEKQSQRRSAHKKGEVQHDPD